MFYNNFFKKITDLNGRSDRLDFWSLWIFTGIFMTVLSYIESLFNLRIFNFYGVKFGYLYLFGFILILWPNIAFEIRRLNDVKINPLVWLLHMVPFVGWAILMIIYLLPSKK